jgi:hypothetical protein
MFPNPLAMCMLNAKTDYTYITSPPALLTNFMVNHYFLHKNYFGNVSSLSRGYNSWHACIGEGFGDSALSE